MRKLATAAALAVTAAGAIAGTASAQSPGPIELDPSQLVIDRVAPLLRPDLTLAGVRLDTAAGTVKVSVRNAGFAGVADSVTRVSVATVDHYTGIAGPVRRIDVHTGLLARGQTRDYVVDLDGQPWFTTPISPLAEITVTADAPGRVAELREDNNSLTIAPRLF